MFNPLPASVFFTRVDNIFFVPHRQAGNTVSQGMNIIPVHMRSIGSQTQIQNIIECHVTKQQIKKSQDLRLSLFQWYRAICTIETETVLNPVDMITNASHVGDGTEPASVLLEKNHLRVTNNQGNQRSQLPTPVRFEVLDEYLDSFDEERNNSLRIGFRDGFKIDFEGEDCELDCVNSKATQELPQAIGEQIN